MGRNKPSSLIAENRELKKQIKSLQRELSRLKKECIKLVHPLDDIIEETKISKSSINNKTNFCHSCNKELITVTLGNKLLRICKECKDRKLIKNEKKEGDS